MAVVGSTDAVHPSGQPPARSTRRKAKRFLVVLEVAEQLGVSERTVYRAIGLGELPAIRILGRWLVPSKAIDRLEERALAGEPAGPPLPLDPPDKPTPPLNGGNPQ